jgi:hypothetical protein
VAGRQGEVRSLLDVARGSKAIAKATSHVKQVDVRGSRFVSAGRKGRIGTTWFCPKCHGTEIQGDGTVEASAPFSTFSPRVCKFSVQFDF